MEKDSIANLVSFTSIAAVFAQWESILTIVLLISAIILNGLRIRDNIVNRKEDK